MAGSRSKQAPAARRPPGRAQPSCRPPVEALLLRQSSPISAYLFQLDRGLLLRLLIPVEASTTSPSGINPRCRGSLSRVPFISSLRPVRSALQCKQAPPAAMTTTTKQQQLKPWRQITIYDTLGFGTTASTETTRRMHQERNASCLAG